MTSSNQEHYQILEKLYSAFQIKDYKTMQSLYHDEATFSDPVFRDLNAEELRAMWEMLIKKGKDLRIEYEVISANDERGEAKWTAYYTFGKSKRPVVNHVQASFEFKDGKIYRHRDEFSFPRWAEQALGLMGSLFGRTQWLRKKVSEQAMRGLEDFMSSSPRRPPRV